MIVGDEIVGVVVVLQIDELLERAEVVADVQSARGLNSRQNAHVPDISIRISDRADQVHT